MTEQFRGKVALVAGGTGAMGSAVSLAFLNKGAKVIVTWRNQEEFTRLTEAASGSTSLVGYQVDATNEVATQDLIRKILPEVGAIEILVNTVGAYAGGTALWETPVEVFDRMVSLNLRSSFALCRAIVPEMLSKKSGSIVNIASRAAFDHAAGAAAYCASKAAAVAMMDSLAADLRETGVRVNSIIPSIIDTEANRKAMPNADFQKWPKPEDIAKVILFWCSDDAKLIHGASVPVYGET